MARYHQKNKKKKNSLCPIILWHLPIQSIECEVTTLLGMVLNYAPKELNDVKFTMTEKRIREFSFGHMNYT